MNKNNLIITSCDSHILQIKAAQYYQRLYNLNLSTHNHFSHYFWIKGVKIACNEWNYRLPQLCFEENCQQQCRCANNCLKVSEFETVVITWKLVCFTVWINSKIFIWVCNSQFLFLCFFCLFVFVCLFVCFLFLLCFCLFLLLFCFCFVFVLVICLIVWLFVCLLVCLFVCLFFLSFSVPYIMTQGYAVILLKYSSTVLHTFDLVNQ